MKDLLEAINTRVKEPYWGFFLLSFIAFNWRGLFLLCFATGTAQEKIDLFDSLTTFWSLVFFPILMALLILLITPWLKVVFGKISRVAYEELNSQDLKREHKYLAEKIQLEKMRALELANKENELIDQAKRDAHIEQIEDENVKDSLKREIIELRNKLKKSVDEEPQSELKNISVQSLSDTENEIIQLLIEDKNNYIEVNRINATNIIRIAGKFISQSQNLRDYFKYQEAIKSLNDKGLLRNINNAGKIYELSELGYEIGLKIDNVANN